MTNHTGKNFAQRLRTVLSWTGFALYVAGKLPVYYARNTVSGKLLIFLLLPLAIVLYMIFRPMPENVTELPKRTLTIPAGANFQQITDSLVSLELLDHKELFLLLSKVTGKDRKIRAGRFNVPEGLTAWQLLNYLENAPSAKIRITFPEGISSERMAGTLEKALGIDSTQFISLVHDSVFAVSLGAKINSLEGYLLPETYFFDWKTPEEALIQHMVSKTLEIFEPDSVKQRLEELARTRSEIIVLASIIEGEAVLDSERVYIASLYHNRLRLGWPLQADPTIQFVIPGPPRRLLNKDLEIDSPYNTYKYSGLPPAPINNPGKKSILAALYPANSDYLYMVAVGDGSHKFSKTLSEHHYWHERFNAVRRRIRREQRQEQPGNAESRHDRDKAPVIRR